MDERVYCCQANADEPMLGTADVVDVWLLVEYRQAWRAKAWTENALADGAKRWLADGVAALAAQGLRVRPQMIRQPEGARAGFRLLVHQEGKLRGFYSRCANYEDLAATPLDALVAGDGGERLRAPHYFVCVNGQRDRCCARFGLPLYRRLRALVGERAWQITHLGGHRFAPNVLVLPQGVLYGRVHPGKLDSGEESLQPGSARGNPSHERIQPGSARGSPSHERVQPGSARGNPSHEGTEPGSARGNPPHEGTEPGSAKGNPSHEDATADFVAAVESGKVPLAHLRGRCCYPQAAQAAEGFAGVDGLNLVGVEDDETGAMVTFARNGLPLRIGTARAPQPMRILASCGDRQTKEVHPYIPKWAE